MKKLSITLINSCVIGMRSCHLIKGTIDQKTVNEVSGILKQYSTEWSEAIKNGDASNIVDYFGPDFIYQSATGILQTKDELLNDINQNTNPIPWKMYRSCCFGRTCQMLPGHLMPNGWIRMVRNRFINLVCQCLAEIRC
jgi:hypothetical protein